MPKPVMLRVLANPFGCELDHEGRAHAHVQYEPNPRGDYGLRWVGCRLHATTIRNADPETQTAGLDDHEWEYDTEPTVVPCTAYYLHHLRAHALLCADAETHRLVFGDARGHRDPKDRLRQYAEERGAHARLKPSEKVLDAMLHDPEYKRDHAAEFHAWVGMTPDPKETE